MEIANSLGYRIAELEDENERLRAEVEGRRNDWISSEEHLADARAENERLRRLLIKASAYLDPLTDTGEAVKIELGNDWAGVVVAPPKRWVSKSKSK